MLIYKYTCTEGHTNEVILHHENEKHDNCSKLITDERGKIKHCGAPTTRGKKVEDNYADHK